MSKALLALPDGSLTKFKQSLSKTNNLFSIPIDRIESGQEPKLFGILCQFVGF